jgi:hypothetical protein
MPVRYCSIIAALSGGSPVDQRTKREWTSSQSAYVSIAMWPVKRDDLAMRGGVGVLAVVTVLVAGCGTATVPRQKQVATPRHAFKASPSQPARGAQGTGSTPGVLPIPQMGFVSFRCDRAFRVQPFFSTQGATNGDDVVTVRAGNVVRRNFTTTVVHKAGKTLHEMTISPRPIIALPYAHYRLVIFVVREGSEARILDATVSAQFVARRVGKHGRPILGACYVKHWSLDLAVR